MRCQVVVRDTGFDQSAEPVVTFTGTREKASVLTDSLNNEGAWRIMITLCNLFLCALIDWCDNLIAEERK